MKKAVLIIMSAFMGLSLTGCSYALEELGVFKTDGSGIPRVGSFEAFRDQPISFEVVKSTSLRTCQECHASGNRAMDTADKVLAQKDSILAAVHKESMPPRSAGYKPLDACEKQILETWVDDQMHERTEVQKVKDLATCANAQAPREKPPTDFKTLELSFENLKTEIFNAKCLVCHSKETARRTVLDDLDLIKAKGLIKESATESILYQIVVPGMYKRFMPPQNGKTSIKPLTAEETDYLKRWIEAGAL
ncbi:MAG: hypothetical protein OM95_10210 [Bdellovibrio sp. ArHS]|uniref:hypothetical protein n=1 Tax=Bdellovibrio sp. ArHS TaxID=1569284 RepID=UPI000583A56C|nr:hypothetical protein [Bdellovibrio sp. ArHS]KHD88141.1 MAG: hypothetical protein OM95_10210 [Bdellovibrio sp. ArHS]